MSQAAVLFVSLLYLPADSEQYHEARILVLAKTRLRLATMLLQEKRAQVARQGFF